MTLLSLFNVRLRRKPGARGVKFGAVIYGKRDGFRQEGRAGFWGVRDPTTRHTYRGGLGFRVEGLGFKV